MDSFLEFRKDGINGCGYETFEISKHFPAKLQSSLIRAETLDKPLADKFLYKMLWAGHFCNSINKLIISSMFLSFSISILAQGPL